MEGCEAGSDSKEQGGDRKDLNSHKSTFPPGLDVQVLLP
jgi:hypothetical protein